MSVSFGSRLNLEKRLLETSTCSHQELGSQEQLRKKQSAAAGFNSVQDQGSKRQKVSVLRILLLFTFCSRYGV